ncbi:nuclear transport factor 2 family protein [Haloferula sp. BvORR071]|uniref:nuclear transport factor 2 family protein n=1 Tax=Haloferula sp. BvORR071 TaxID=1396141 RepID=UPI0005539855|nr:nuclear transport factor 2 family protein [Haloferula sp. BvORR071]
MKASLIALFLITIPFHGAVAQAEESKPAAAATSAEKEIIELSKQKWDWMAEKKVEPLADLFHEKAVFVHMGGSWGTKQELDTINGGGIHYKHAEIQETSVQIIGDTAILLSKIRLDAVVGGNEVTNPFTVTEVFVKVEGKWKLGSLSFTKMGR